MRFAELLLAPRRGGAPARRRRLLDGVSDGMSSIKSAVTPSRCRQAAAAPVRPAPPVFEAPVNPTTQRAFDDASRALRSGRVDEAERAYRALAQANPELGGPHANLGLIYRQAGKLAESASELEQAVKLSPRQPIFLNQLGVTYRQQGQFAKARDAYQKAIALDPGYAAPALNLGILYDLYLGDSAPCARAVRPLPRPLAERRRDGNQMGRRPQEPQARADHRQPPGEAMNASRFLMTGLVVAGAAALASVPAAAQTRAAKAEAAAAAAAAAVGAGAGPRRPRPHPDHRQPRAAEGPLHRALEEARCPAT